MASLWNQMKDSALKVGQAAGVASQKAKLKAEMMLTEREISGRQQAFGVELYDHVSPLTSHSGFYESDDKLTETIRPPLITAQREIAALEIKKTQLREQLAQAEAKRRGIAPAQNWQEKVMNAGVGTARAGNEAKIKAEIALNERAMKKHKQDFGLTLYPIFESLEDTSGWLPTNREIRSIYDSCRKDIEKLREKKDGKARELHALGVPEAETAAWNEEARHQTTTADNIDLLDPYAI